MRAPPEARIVVIRHASPRTGTHVRLAWLLSVGNETAVVRHRVGGVSGGYLPRRSRILRAEILRPATPRERDMGKPLEMNAP
jgi:hypothetical protein